MKSSDSLKKIARRLLATTCLTAAAVGVSQAASVTETTFGDFGNTFALQTLLPAGTTEVIGAINPSSDFDFFTISNLVAGGNYSITGVYTGNASYSVLSSANVVLSPGTSNPAVLSGVVPGDGILVIAVGQQEQVATYDLTLDVASTPEPATVAGVGLALAAGLAARRNRSK